MEQKPYHILWVSSTPSVPMAFQQLATRQAASSIQFSQAAPYYPAIQAVEYAAPDAVMVMDDFDSLAVLEFVHHARLLDGQVPIIILCKEYDAALDYKSRKLGATDCVTLAEVDGPYLSGLVQQRQVVEHGVRRGLRMGIFQFTGLFK